MHHFQRKNTSVLIQIHRFEYKIHQILMQNVHLPSRSIATSNQSSANERTIKTDLRKAVVGIGSVLTPPRTRCRFHIKWPVFSAKILQIAPGFGENVAKKRPNNMKYAAAVGSNHHFSREESSFSLEEPLQNLRFLLKNVHFCIKNAPSRARFPRGSSRAVAECAANATYSGECI